MSRGRFIAFEGHEGSGKTTTLAAIKGALEERGYEVAAFQCPGTTDLGKFTRQIMHGGVPLHPYAEIPLLLSVWADLYHGTILPALEHNDFVLVDRMVPITGLFCQLIARMPLEGTSRREVSKKIQAWWDWYVTYAGLLGIEKNADRLFRQMLPDAVVHCDVPIEIAKQRAAKKRSVAADRIEDLPDVFEKSGLFYGDCVDFYRQKTRIIAVNTADGNDPVSRLMPVERKLPEKAAHMASTGYPVFMIDSFSGRLDFYRDLGDAALVALHRSRANIGSGLSIWSMPAGFDSAELMWDGESPHSVTIQEAQFVKENGLLSDIGRIPASDLMVRAEEISCCSWDLGPSGLLPGLIVPPDHVASAG